MACLSFVHEPLLRKLPKPLPKSEPWQVQASEKFGLIPENSLLEQAIQEAKELGDIELARDLTMQLRISKTGVEEQRWGRWK